MSTASDSFQELQRTIPGQKSGSQTSKEDNLFVAAKIYSCESMKKKKTRLKKLKENKEETLDWILEPTASARGDFVVMVTWK